VRETRPRGSVRGALSNGRPYRDTAYCLTQECSQRIMPLPHSDVLECLTGFPIVSPHLVQVTEVAKPLASAPSIAL